MRHDAPRLIVSQVAAVHSFPVPSGIPLRRYTTPFTYPVLRWRDNSQPGLFPVLMIIKPSKHLRTENKPLACFSNNVQPRDVQLYFFFLVFLSQLSFPFSTPHVLFSTERGQKQPSEASRGFRTIPGCVNSQGGPPGHAPRIWSALIPTQRGAQGSAPDWGIVETVFFPLCPVSWLLK